MAGVLVLGLAMSGSAGAHQVQKPDGKAPARLDRYQVAAGSALLLTLRTSLDSASMSVRDQVEATLWSPVIQDGVELIPAGSVVYGTVVSVVRASDRAPVGSVTFAFSIIEHSETRSRESLTTRRVVMEAPRQADVEPGRGKKRRRQKPVDAVVPAGTPFVAVTAEPLIVLVPR